MNSLTFLPAGELNAPYPIDVTSIGTAAFYGTDLQAVYIKTTGWKQSGTGSTYDFSDPYAAASIFRKMSFAAYR